MSSLAPLPATPMLDKGALPPGWELVRVRDVGDVQLGRQRAPQHHTGPHMRPYLRAANVTWGGVNVADVLEMNFTPQEFESYRLQRDDILLSEASGSPSEVGKPAIWNDELPACCFQNTLIRVRSKGPLPKYLYFQFLYFALSGRFGETAKGVGIHHLGAERLAEFEVLIAPLAEQRRIVEAIETELTRLDAGVASLRAARAKLRRYRASVLKAACEGRLMEQDPSDEPASALLSRIAAERAQMSWARGRRSAGIEGGHKAHPHPAQHSDSQHSQRVGAPLVGALNEDSALPELPAGWAWVSVDQILGSPLSNGRSVPDSDRGFPVLRLTALKGERLDLRERKIGAWNREEALPFLVRLGDFFVARGSGSIRLVGRGAEVRDEPDEVAFPDTLIRVRPDPALCLTTYLAVVWSSQLMRSQIETTARTTAGIYKISQQDIQSFTLPLPPLAEQRRIVAEVERRLSVVAAMEAAVAANLKRAERLRQAILKRAFEGKLVPQDPSDEPASALLERIRAARQEAAAAPGSNGRRGRPRKAEGAAQKAPSDTPKRRGRPRKGAAQPTGRELPASEPVREAEQLRMDDL